MGCGFNRPKRKEDAMKRLVIAGVVLVVVALSLVGASVAHGQVSATARTKATAGSALSVTSHFYSDEVHFDVHYHAVSPPGACVKDQYGGYVNNDYACTQFEQNDASWDVRIWQTTPSWKLVHSAREFGIEGQGSADIFYGIDLNAGYLCYTKWRHNYKAVFRLFSPLTSRTLAIKSVTFWVGCR
jgi:hypothetical protein